MRNILLGALVFLSSGIVWGSSDHEIKRRTVYLKQSKNGCFEHGRERYNVKVTLSSQYSMLETDVKNHLALDSLRVFNNIKKFGEREIDLGLIPGAFDAGACFTTASGEKTYMDQFFGDETEPVLTKKSQEDVDKRLRWLIDNDVEVDATLSSIRPIFTLLGAHNSGNKKQTLAVMFYHAHNAYTPMLASAQAYFKKKTDEGADKKEVQADVIARLKVFESMRDSKLNDRMPEAQALKDPEKFFPTEDGKSKETKSKRTKKRTRANR